MRDLLSKWENVFALLDNKDSHFESKNADFFRDFPSST